jgi:membrane fusion protein, multidrug efflux system
MKRGVLALMLAALVAAGCKKDGDPKKDQPGAKTDLIYPVEVTRVEVREVEYVIDAVGSIDAFETVQVTARVAGAVERVLFREGDRVKKGQALVEIEPARYTLAVRNAEATLARASAAAVDAKRGFERREKMAKEGVASVEEMETFKTRLETAGADMSAARAQLALAQLNLRDAFVTAPITGVVQTRTVQTGQYVQPGAGGMSVLATLVRREPLLVRFKVAEHEAMRLSVDAEARFTVRGGTGSKTAIIKHIAARADEVTRMVDVIAEVANKDPELRPGAFAEVQIPNGGARAAVVPQTAVRPSDRGFLSFVIADGKAEERVVRIGRRTAGGLVEVLDGLKDGDQVVVRGAEALSSGAPVKVMAGAAPSASVVTEPAAAPKAP